VAVTEAARHQLYGRLEEVLGHEEATTLMDHLPQGGWANLATKDDIAQLRAATKGDIDSLAALTGVRFDAMNERSDDLAKKVCDKIDYEIAALRHFLEVSLHETIWRYSMTFLGILIAGAGAIATIMAAVN
jgi:hypothetical protein